jgi:protein arginine N-methyltransferase 1
MYVCGLKDGREQKLEKRVFWSDVYGVDMTPLGINYLTEPLVDLVDPDDIVTSVCEFYSLDLNTCQESDIVFANTYKIAMEATSRVDALVAWFDCDFNTQPVLTTSPFTPPTHWKQVVFWIDGEFQLDKGDTLEGTIACRPSPKH